MMLNKGVRIERITIGELYSFACRALERAAPDEPIPITKHLALAQQHNPYAGQHDIGLVVAYVGGRCAGYMGLIPGLLRTGEQLSKVYWGSTLFVAPEYRPMGVGIFLIKNILSLKCDFVGAEMSLMAEQVWRKLGLLGRLPARDCYVLDVNPLNVADSPLRSLQRCSGNVRYLSGAAARAFTANKRVVFPSVKKYYYRMLRKRCEKKLTCMRYTEVGEINNFSYEKVPNRPHCEFHRGLDWINWKLKYRWMLGKDEVDVSYDNYHFRGVRDAFKIFAVEISSADRDEYKGFLVLSLSIEGRECTLKILDYFLYDPGDAEYVVALAIQYADTYQADRVIIPDRLAPYFRKNVLTKYFLSATRHLYICRPESESSPLSLAIPHIQLDLCDGDYSFT